MARKKSVSKTSEGLIAALSFISVAQKKEDDIPYKTHCILHNNQALAYDGVLTAGCKIEESLEICPQTYKLIAALERTTKDVSITELEGRLSIKSGSFSCFVPCWHEGMPSLAPDPALCGISDVLKIGFDMISAFTVNDEKKRIVECSILLRANSMIATDTAVMLEFWHGLNLPTIVLPKAFVTAILNTNKSLKAFGYSGNSCTFWFEDDSWIKTQLYDESWPDVDVILNKPCKPEPLPKGFYEALKNIEPFSNGKDTEKAVYFYEGALQSHRDKAEGATCECAGIKHGPAFNIKRLKRIEHCIETVDFYSHNAAFFFSKCGKVRGAIMGVMR
jgi:hypothetical protein